jgi:class 3 adenylate cyclase/tetratricopeptide (TPR) repeat protein
LNNQSTQSSISDRLANWKQEASHWGSDPDDYLLFGNRAMETGQPSISYEIFKAGLIQNPSHPELTYRAALALARCHSTLTAAIMLKQLLDDLSESDPIIVDVYSLAGRLAKDQWALTLNAKDKTRLAKESTAYYKRAYKISSDYYPGINAATMSMVASDESFGKELAAKIKTQCIEGVATNGSNDYWLTATLGEACLLLGEQEESAKWYQQATDAIKQDYGNLAAIRRQVKLLTEIIPVDDAIIKLLEIPTVVVFTGNMIDAPDREVARFTPGMEVPVKQAIVDAVDRLDAGFAYCSAACGADILFIEAMLERGAEVHVILPFKKEDFIMTSVAFAGDEWVKRFNDVIERVEYITYATDEGFLNDDILFEYCASLMSGMAILRAEQLETEPVLLAALDSSDEIKPGGTSANVLNWKKSGNKTEIIELNKLKGVHYETDALTTEKNNIDVNGNEINNTALSHTISRNIKTMLFADVVGFSKLGEEEAPSFFVNFLEEIAHIIHSHTVPPTFCNTWGDGIFLVYDEIEVAADIALYIRDKVKQKNWQDVGLPEETNIRIGLHTGPVYSATDPIIKKENFYGTHVNRAARIEPITTPGSVFISEQAASILTVTNNDEFICGYLGSLDLAKKYGTGVIYRLRRKGEIE